MAWFVRLSEVEALSTLWFIDPISISDARTYIIEFNGLLLDTRYFLLF